MGLVYFCDILYDCHFLIPVYYSMRNIRISAQVQEFSGLHNRLLSPFRQLLRAIVLHAKLKIVLLLTQTQHFNCIFLFFTSAQIHLLVYILCVGLYIELDTEKPRISCVIDTNNDEGAAACGCDTPSASDDS